MAGKVGYSSLRPSPRTPRIETMRTVLVVLFDDVQSLDVTGPVEVFAGAEAFRGGSYRIHTASLDGAPVRTTSGLTLVPDHTLADAPAPHTLLVPGGRGTRRPDPRLTDWLRAHGPRAERLVSVCTGAIPLAEAGLLDGRRATTHWAYCDKLARDHPAIEVDPDPIYVRDGQVSTSAGVTSGIDLALALVEEDLGREAALTVARHLVVSCGARATRPSSAPSWPRRRRGANRSARSSSGSPSTPATTCPSSRSPSAPGSRRGTSPAPSRPRRA